MIPQKHGGGAAVPFRLSLRATYPLFYQFTMRVFLTLLFKELRAFFYSPVAYVVLALVMIINGFSFRAAIVVLESSPQQGSIVTWTFNSQWFWLSYFFLFPLLTMRLFTEERKMGTFETLFTAPVQTWQVVGKVSCLRFHLLPVVGAELFELHHFSKHDRWRG